MSQTAMHDLSRSEERTARDLGGLFYGVYPGLVVDAVDPEHLGRVKLRFPWLPDKGGPEVWARLASLTTADLSGSWFPPAVGSEVLVAFEAGDMSRPYVIGMLWNGVDKPPSSDIKVGEKTQLLSTPSGTRIVFDEGAGGSRLRLETAGGQRVFLSDDPEGVLIEDSNGSKVTLKDGNVEVEAGGRVTVSAAQVEVSAGAVSIDTGLLSVSGVVKCSILQTETVVATTYTPGAGNVW